MNRETLKEQFLAAGNALKERLENEQAIQNAEAQLALETKKSLTNEF